MLESLERRWILHSLAGDDSLQTEPAVEALCNLYALNSLPAPDYVLILDSPLAAAVAWPAVRLFSPLLSVSPPVTPAPVGNLQRQVEELVRAPVSRWLDDKSFSFIDRVWDLLEARLPWVRGVRGCVSPRPPWEPTVVPFARLGCGNPGWLAHGELLRERGGMPDRFWHEVMTMAQAGVWDCLLTERCAILVRRPAAVHRDGEGRLHCATGTAYSWGDGFSGFALHGLRVPFWVVQYPERLTVGYVWETKNLEMRRVLIDRFGRERFLALSRATVAHQDFDRAGMPRRLLKLPDDLCYVEVQCPSTRHVHILQVPPTVRTCHEAVAWTFGMAPEEYAPLVEA